MGQAGRSQSPSTRVHLNRALSKLGILTRSQANEAILAGRVTVNGRIVRDPAHPVSLAKARIVLDGERREAAPWRAIVFNKPRGVVTTRRDPGGRKTVYDVLGAAGEGLVPVGRLDLATSGLLLLTSDTSLAAWIENPANAVPRTYLVTVRGQFTDADARMMIAGVEDRGERLSAKAVDIRKASARESHLTMTLVEGKNREIRRLCAACGNEVTRLKRVQLGDLALADLAPGTFRELTREEVWGSGLGARDRDSGLGARGSRLGTRDSRLTGDSRLKTVTGDSDRLTTED